MSVFRFLAYSQGASRLRRSLLATHGDLQKQTWTREVAFAYGERCMQLVADYAWLLISDNPHYEKELIKPGDMKDVEILRRCEIRIGRVS